MSFRGLRSKDTSEGNDEDNDGDYTNNGSLMLKTTKKKQASNYFVDILGLVPQDSHTLEMSRNPTLANLFATQSFLR